DEVELELVLVDALGAELEDAHLLELERDAAGGAEGAVAAVERGADVGDGAGGVVRGGLDEDGDAVGAVGLVEDLLVVRHVAALRALDGGLDLALRHVHALRVLEDAAERGVVVGVRAAGLHGDDDVLPDAGELLRHAVPPGEHGGLADFEDASHRGVLPWGAKNGAPNVRCPAARGPPALLRTPTPLRWRGARRR